MFKRLFNEKNRWISALIIISIILPILFITFYTGKAGKYVGMIFYVCIGILGVFEIFSSMKINKWIALLTSSILVVFFVLPNQGFLQILNNNLSKDLHILVINSLSWQNYLLVILASFIPIIADANFRKTIKNVFLTQFIITALLIIVATFCKIFWVFNTQHILIPLFFMLIPIISDTFAYIGGMFFGKKLFNGAKFAPRLSPKKTWAGFVIGLTFALAFAIPAGYFWNVWITLNSNQIFLAIFLGLILCIASPYGDLAFSGIKRYIGVKDYSNLIPSHGGIFDRLDAMCIVFFVASIIYLF